MNGKRLGALLVLGLGVVAWAQDTPSTTNALEKNMETIRLAVAADPAVRWQSRNETRKAARAITMAGKSALAHLPELVKLSDQMREITKDFPTETAEAGTDRFTRAYLYETIAVLGAIKGQKELAEVLERLSLVVKTDPSPRVRANVNSLLKQYSPPAPGAKAAANPPPRPQPKDAEQLEVGLSDDDVLALLGEPEKRHRAGSEDTVFETWQYKDGTTVMLQNGIVSRFRKPEKPTPAASRQPSKELVGPKAIGKWDGFRGIAWGTPLEKIPGMTTSELKSTRLTYCTREDDKMAVGEAKLTRLEYIFYKDQFCGVYLKTEGSGSFDALKRAVFANWGAGERPNRFLNEWTWLQGKVVMSLNYNEYSHEGILILAYTPLFDAMDRDKDRAAHNAKKDF